MSKKALFIVFEGLDGSGLSTQAGMLRDYFLKKGERAVITKEQTDGLIGGLIKLTLKHEWKTNPTALQLLFAADRSHHLSHEIEPSLKEGKHVISDRYILSTLAFGSLGAQTEFLKQINSLFKVPDITFIIDVPPEVCLERIAKSRFHAELFEEEEKFSQIRNNYLSFKQFHPNTYVINGNRPMDEVFEEIRTIVEKYS